MNLWHRIGRRGATLLVLAMVDLTLGYSMLTAPPLIIQTAYIGHEYMFAIDLWGYMWFAVAVALMICSLFRDDRIGFGIAMGVKVLWAIGFYVSLIHFGVTRAIVGAALWTLIPAWLFLVAGWPEATKERDVPN